MERCGETHIFSVNVVNEFRAGFNRVSNALAPFMTQNLYSQYGFLGIPQQPGLAGLPTIKVNGYAQMGEAGYLPDAKGSDTFQTSDSVTWNKGSHFIQLGGEYRWVRSRYHIWANARGSYTFNGIFTGTNGNTSSTVADFLLAYPSGAALDSVIVGDIRYKYYGGYVNDDWKVTPNLTLNIGLRYEYFTAPYERNNLNGNLVVGPNKLIYANNNVPPSTPAAYAMNIPSGIDNRGLVSTKADNFAPRLGLAYQIAPKTVFRAGGGFFYGDPGAAGISSRPEDNPPFQVSYAYTSDNIHPILNFATGFPSNAINPTLLDPSTTSMNAWDLGAATPLIFHWNASLEQQVGRFLVDANYVGTKGEHLNINYNINAAYPGGGSAAIRRPIQGFNDINFVTPMGNSEYNALQMRVQRRYANGISLLVSYTWSKSIDLGGGQLVGDMAMRNRSNVGWERAASSSSVPQRLVVSYTYALPVGRGLRFNPSNRVLSGIIGNWQVNGITTVRDGHPFTVTTNVSSANTGQARPNWDPNAHTPGFSPSINEWFDLAQFPTATQYNFSNEGRDVVYGPGAVNFDASLFKRVRLKMLRETGQLELRFEGFNIFNHPQFGQPNVNVSTVGAGTITFLTTSMRQLQAGLKILF
jgi:hypothetical protein